jgi:hypothetical protein
MRRLLMKALVRTLLCIALLAGSSFAQQAAAAAPKKPGVIEAADLKTVVPTNYFFDSLVASVQSRNSGAARFGNGKMLVAAFVDNSGYSADISRKYQGLLIVETKVSIGDAELEPGEYGFGFVAEGKFLVLNVAADEVLHTTYQTDETLKRPVPLKIVADGDGYRLYAGKKYVTIKAK